MKQIFGFLMLAGSLVGFMFFLAAHSSWAAVATAVGIATGIVLWAGVAIWLFFD